MPIRAPHLNVCSTMRRSTRRYKPPLFWGARACSAACLSARRIFTRAKRGCAPRAAIGCPLLGHRGMQRCMPIRAPYLYGCLTRRRPTRRYEPPLVGAQGYACACLSARRTFTCVRLGGAPRAAKSRPLLGRRGMQCCWPISTPYLLAGSTRRRPTRRHKPPLVGAQGHAMLHAHQSAVS